MVAVANVQHLATLVEGRLSSPGALGPRAGGGPPPDPGGGRLAPRPRPSPGSPPTRASTAAATPARCGWVDARGNGTWAVTLRAAELDGARARLIAGVGVLPDSDPAAELAETNAKFEALLTALVRP